MWPLNFAIEDVATEFHDKEEMAFCVGRRIATSMDHVAFDCFLFLSIVLWSLDGAKRRNHK